MPVSSSVVLIERNLGSRVAVAIAEVHHEARVNGIVASTSVSVTIHQVLNGETAVVEASTANQAESLLQWPRLEAAGWRV